MVDPNEVGDRHPERFRAGPDNDWTLERVEDGSILLRRWREGEELERFSIGAARWVEAVVHLAHESHGSPVTARITRAQLEYIHLGPRKG